MTTETPAPAEALSLAELKNLLREREEAETFLATADPTEYTTEKALRRWQSGIWQLSLPALRAAVHHAER